MYTRWTEHLNNDKDKEEFEKEIIRAKRVLDRLKTIYEEDREALDRSEENQRIYDLPNWSHRQAHKNGVRQSIRENIRFVDLDQQKRKTEK